MALLAWKLWAAGEGAASLACKLCAAGEGTSLGLRLAGCRGSWRCCRGGEGVAVLLLDPPCWSAREPGDATALLLLPGS